MEAPERMEAVNKMMVAYSISERGGKNHWHRIGVGFLNSDGSINVKLEALPVTGEVHLRYYVLGPDCDQEIPQDHALVALQQLIDSVTPEERKVLEMRVRDMFRKAR